MRSFNNSPSPVQLFSALFIVRSLNPFIEGIKVINIHLKILKKKKKKNSRRESHTRERKLESSFYGFG